MASELKRQRGVVLEQLDRIEGFIRDSDSTPNLTEHHNQEQLDIIGQCWKDFDIIQFGIEGNEDVNMEEEEEQRATFEDRCIDARAKLRTILQQIQEHGRLAANVSDSRPLQLDQHQRPLSVIQQIYKPTMESSRCSGSYGAKLQLAQPSTTTYTCAKKYESAKDEYFLVDYLNATGIQTPRKQERAISHQIDQHHLRKSQWPSSKAYDTTAAAIQAARIPQQPVTNEHRDVVQRDGFEPRISCSNELGSLVIFPRDFMRKESVSVFGKRRLAKNISWKLTAKETVIVPTALRRNRSSWITNAASRWKSTERTTWSWKRTKWKIPLTRKHSKKRTLLKASLQGRRYVERGIGLFYPCVMRTDGAGSFENFIVARGERQQQQHHTTHGVVMTTTATATATTHEGTSRRKRRQPIVTPTATAPLCHQ